MSALYSVRGYIVLLVRLSFLFCLIKIIFLRNHYLAFLLLIEIMMLISYVFLLVESFNSRSSSLRVFMMITIIVSGACLGMSIAVAISRSFSKDIELFFIKV